MRVAKIVGLSALVLNLMGCGDTPPYPTRTASTIASAYSATVTTIDNIEERIRHRRTTTLFFDAKQTGAYLFEFRSPLREGDGHVDSHLDFNVEQLPFSKTIPVQNTALSNPIYRIDITHSDGKRIEKTTINVPY